MHPQIVVGALCENLGFGDGFRLDARVALDVYAVRGERVQLEVFVAKLEAFKL